jgi:hypothetical protein
MIELGSVALIGAFLTATFTWGYYGLFLLPLAISILTPRSSMRWWVSWVSVYCVFTSDVWKTERLPNLANDLLSGMFAFGLAFLLCSIWVHSYRTRHRVSTRGGCEPGWASGGGGIRTHGPPRGGQRFSRPPRSSAPAPRLRAE